jgi:hypothetical protein
MYSVGGVKGICEFFWRSYLKNRLNAGVAAEGEHEKVGFCCGNIYI